MSPKTEPTTWELWTYDVWGNATDGFEVNDRSRAGSVSIRLKVHTYNAGTPHEFAGAAPTDYQIRRHAFDCDGRIETDGDDLTIYVNRARDGYPIGEMHCTSHESLSPIRKRADVRNSTDDERMK